MHSEEPGVDVATGGANSVGVSVGVSVGGSKLEDRQWRRFKLIDQVAMSKHTVLYAEAAFEHAFGPDAHALVLAIAPAARHSQRVLRVGVNHMF